MTTTRERQTTPATLHDVIGQVAAEVATPLTRALDRVLALEAGAPADPVQLRALHDEIAHARRIGILGQQIARLASGTVRQVLEPVDLAGMLRELLAEHRRDSGPGVAPVHDKLSAATVVADSGLAGALLRSMLDWCIESARSPIELRLDTRLPATQAVLTCRFARASRMGDNPEPLSWHLMHYAAAPLGARLDVDDGGASVTLRLSIDRLVVPAAPGQTASADMRLLAGCQLLVVSPDRDMRHQVRRAVQGLDLLVDYVTSVDAACDYCDDGLPQAVVYASALAGASLDRLRRRLDQLAGAPPFIEISPERQNVEAPVAAERTGTPRVGLDELSQALPAALVIEMTRRR
jgi:hypothetical protein